VDVLAVIATVMGIGTSLGLGVLQIGGGLKSVFGLQDSMALQLLIVGAMFAAYDRCKTAADVAKIGVMAGAEFDTATQGPIVLHTVKLARSRK